MRMLTPVMKPDGNGNGKNDDEDFYQELGNFMPDGMFFTKPGLI